MVKKIETANVKIWGESAGAVSWLEDRGVGVFEFEPSFLKKGLNLSPIHMNFENSTLFSFPGLNKETFFGLPGLLADALPDKFGNSIINKWLAAKGRDPKDFSPIERLCYTGTRGMGALEFFPAVNDRLNQSVSLEITELVDLAQQVLSERTNFEVEFSKTDKEKEEAITNILRIGTSAGGARPKAIVAINKDDHVISGQSGVPEDYDHWLLKFDGVNDLELGEPKSYGRIEYAYHLMAMDAGINMSECRLLEESGRAHFLTKRFDRVKNQKIHLQSLCGLAHYDFNHAGAYGYEQVFTIMRQLRLKKEDAVQQYRRMIFNVVARNQDDHTKNIAFIMNKGGKWRLSPAFDVTYSHNPAGQWTNQHQLSINGKRDNFTKKDLTEVGESISLNNPQEIINEIVDTVSSWPEYAKQAGVDNKIISEIGRFHRLKLGSE